MEYDLQVGDKFTNTLNNEYTIITKKNPRWVEILSEKGTIWDSMVGSIIERIKTEKYTNYIPIRDQRKKEQKDEKKGSIKEIDRRKNKRGIRLYPGKRQASTGSRLVGNSERLCKCKAKIKSSKIRGRKL